MNIYIEENYNQFSQRAASDELAYLKSLSKPLICPATGDSPKGMYRHIAQQVAEEKIDISAWRFVGLDEWIGMNASDEGSCHFHLNNDLLILLKAPDDNVFFFDGKAADLESEVERTDRFLEKNGPIDLAILGIGLNGHIGMNEPGTDPSLHTHIASIDAITQESGQKYFTKPKDISRGITLGIADIMEARNVFLLISGQNKSPVARAFVEGIVSRDLPATFLQDHPNCSVYLDEAAATLLKK